LGLSHGFSDIYVDPTRVSLLLLPDFLVEWFFIHLPPHTDLFSGPACTARHVGTSVPLPPSTITRLSIATAQGPERGPHPEVTNRYVVMYP
jgi:hypothetical protein